MNHTTKSVSTEGREICMYCAHMNPVNGYCPRTGDYVNAFSSCGRFQRPDEIDDVPTVQTDSFRRREYQNHRKGSRPSAGRTEKYCSRCGELKPIEQFVKLRRSADGHGCYCLECNRIRHRKYRQTN